MKLYISQPMNGYSQEVIEAKREKLYTWAKANRFEVADTDFSVEFKENPNLPVYFLAKAIEKMADCHTVIFANGWENARGCRVEHLIATEYGLNIVYE